MTSRGSPTWSVYDSLWGCDGDGGEEDDAIPFLSDAPPALTLKGSGLKKKELLSRGAQGAVYAAYDTTTTTVTMTEPSAEADEEGVGGGPVREAVVVAVKRLFLQPSDFGARGVAESVLREATLLRYVAAKQEQQQQQQQQQQEHLVDATARVIQLYRVVEAPHRELCLVLEYCALDLRRLAIDERKRTMARHVPGTVWGYPLARDANNNGEEEGRETDDANGRLPMSVIQYILRRVLRIVIFLHEECHILHRDLKLSNLLVTREGHLRLSDFGSARFMKAKPEQDHGGHRGAADSDGMYTPAAMRTTRLYQSPECLLGSNDYGVEAEVWSVGVMFAELLRQTHLLHGDSDLSLLSAIWKLLGAPAKHGTTQASDLPDFGNNGAESSPQHQQQLPTPTLPLKFNASVVPPEGYDLLQRMLTLLPQDRITTREALAHPFLACDAAADAEAATRWRRIVESAIALSQTTVRVHMEQLPQPSGVRLTGFRLAAGGGGGLGLASFSEGVRLGLALGEEGESDDDEGTSEEDAEVAPPVFRLNP